MTTSPPSFAQILDWLEGRLDDETAKAMAKRVGAGDHHTRATVDWLQGFLDTAATLPLHEPPPLVRHNLAAYFGDWNQARLVRERRPVLETPVLLFDSRRDLALTGIRSVDSGQDVAHVAYVGETADLVLDVTPLGGGQVRLDGQVLLRDDSIPSVFEAEIHGPGFRERTVDGDEWGRFALPSVPETADRLVVANAHLEITAALDLRGDQS